MCVDTDGKAGENASERLTPKPASEKRKDIPSVKSAQLNEGESETGVHITPESQHNQRLQLSIMILPQVHLRKPCYDFYFL